MMLLLNEELFFYCFDKDLYFFVYVDKNRDNCMKYGRYKGNIFWLFIMICCNY